MEINKYKIKIEHKEKHMVVQAVSDTVPVLGFL